MAKSKENSTADTTDDNIIEKSQAKVEATNETGELQPDIPGEAMRDGFTYNCKYNT